MRYLLLGAGPVQDRALRQLVEVAPELPGDLYGLGFARGQIATWQRRQAAWSALLGPLPESSEERILREHAVLYYLTDGPEVLELELEQRGREGAGSGRASEVADAYAYQALLAAQDWHFEKARTLAAAAAEYDPARYRHFAGQAERMARKSL